MKFLVTLIGVLAATLALAQTSDYQIENTLPPKAALSIVLVENCKGQPLVVAATMPDGKLLMFTAESTVKLAALAEWAEGAGKKVTVVVPCKNPGVHI